MNPRPRLAQVLNVNTKKNSDNWQKKKEKKKKKKTKSLSGTRSRPLHDVNVKELESHGSIITNQLEREMLQSGSTADDNIISRNPPTTRPTIRPESSAHQSHVTLTI